MSLSKRNYNILVVVQAGPKLVIKNLFGARANIEKYIANSLWGSSYNAQVGRIIQTIRWSHRALGQLGGSRELSSALESHHRPSVMDGAAAGKRQRGCVRVSLGITSISVERLCGCVGALKSRQEEKSKSLSWPDWKQMSKATGPRLKVAIGDSRCVQTRRY